MQKIITMSVTFLITSLFFNTGYISAQEINSPKQQEESSSDKNIHEAAPELKKAVFIMPTNWREIPQNSYSAGFRVFVTNNEDPVKGLMVIFREFRELNHSAMEWARDELESLNPHGIIVLEEPKEIQRENLKWAFFSYTAIPMESKGESREMKFEQYYTRGKETMIEVAVSGIKEIAEKYNKKEMEDFLSGVRLDTNEWDVASEVIGNIRKK